MILMRKPKKITKNSIIQEKSLPLVTMKIELQERLTQIQNWMALFHSKISDMKNLDGRYILSFSRLSSKGLPLVITSLQGNLDALPFQLGQLSRATTSLVWPGIFKVEMLLTGKEQMVEALQQLSQEVSTS